MAEESSSIKRRDALGAGGLGLLVAALAESANAAEPASAAETANLAAVTSLLRGFNDAAMDAGGMAGLFTEDCRIRLSENAPLLRGRFEAVELFKKTGAAPERRDIRIVEAFSRGPIVAAWRDEILRGPGRIDQHRSEEPHV